MQIDIGTEQIKIRAEHAGSAPGYRRQWNILNEMCDKMEELDRSSDEADEILACILLTKRRSYSHFYFKVIMALERLMTFGGEGSHLEIHKLSHLILIISSFEIPRPVMSMFLLKIKCRGF
jgi:hypothetical protein